MTPVLVDTNILVYAHDPAEKLKYQKAIRVLKRLEGLASGRLSTQGLAEFFNAVCRGSRPRLTEEEAAVQLERLVLAWPTFDITPLIVLEAVRGVRQHRLPYWDAQIWATARLNQVPVVFTEDLPGHSPIEGITFINPLDRSFSLDAWQ